MEDIIPPYYLRNTKNKFKGLWGSKVLYNYNKISLGRGKMKYKIYYYDKLESTNDKAKILAGKLEEGSIILADEQTKGRGRLGRTWHSTRGKSINMTIILKPKVKNINLQGLTLVTSVAINLALRDIGIDSQIKWPNDILVNNKKVSGILIEVSRAFNKINYVIVGIGINVNQDKGEIPRVIMEKSTSLKIAKSREIDRGILLGNILNRFKESYLDLKLGRNIDRIIDIYKKHSVIIGREVLLIQGKDKRRARVLDISKKGELLVKTSQGIERIGPGAGSIRI